MTSRNNQKGSTLIIVLIVGILISFTAMSTFTSSNFSMTKTSQRERAVSAFNIAEAGKEHAIAQICADFNLLIPHTRNTIFENEALEEHGSYTVSCSTNALKDSIWIRSVGSISDNSTTIDVICVPTMVSKRINPRVIAAVSTRSSFSYTGSIVIDGRDHHYVSGMVLGDGVAGVCYLGQLTRSGSAAKIGGNGFPPVINPIPLVADPNGGSNPTTPEQALGLEAGDLDDYIVDTIPSGPLNFQREIVYISPPAGEEIWRAPKLNGSSGIFIFHNESRTAQLKNIHGDFKGIIIADQIVHFNGNAVFYGVIFTLSDEEGRNVFGNGNANIRFSQALINLIREVVTVDKPGGLQEVAWKQE